MNDVALGKNSRAVIKVATILGSRYLALEPEDGGTLPDNTFDLAHTEVPYDLQEALADVTTTYEQVDTDAFAKSLGILGTQMQGLPAVVPEAMRNIQTLSTVIADRRDQLGALLKSTDMVSSTLERQHANIAAMINQGQELIGRFVERSATFHAMMAALTNLVNTLSTTVVTNRGELDQTITNLRQLSDLLAQHDDLLRSTLQAGPVALRGFANASGTGNAVRLQHAERSGHRLLDVRHQRAGQAVRHDPVLQGLQVSARARLLALLTVIAVVVASVVTVAWVYFKSTSRPHHADGPIRQRRRALCRQHGRGAGHAGRQGHRDHPQERLRRGPVHRRPRRHDSGRCSGGDDIDLDPDRPADRAHPALPGRPGTARTTTPSG